MKAFKKWMQTQDPNYNHKLCCIGAEEHGMKEGWKVALEWVLSNLDGKTDILELGLRIREEQDYE